MGSADLNAEDTAFFRSSVIKKSSSDQCQLLLISSCCFYLAHMMCQLLSKVHAPRNVSSSHVTESVVCRVYFFPFFLTRVRPLPNRGPMPTLGYSVPLDIVWAKSAFGVLQTCLQIFGPEIGVTSSKVFLFNST